MKVLISGANGFLGKQLVREFSGIKNIEVLGPTRDELDFSDTDKVFAFWEKFKPDVLVHAVAFARGLKGNIDAAESAFLMNEAVIRAPLLAALRFGVKRVIFCGTVAEYGFPYSKLPLEENQVAISLPHVGEVYYGLAKRLSNQYLDAIRLRWGAKAIHLLMTNLYGPGDRFDAESGHAVSSILLKVGEAKREAKSVVEIWGSPETTRDFLFVKDAAKIIGGLVSNKEEIPEVLNVASGTETTLGELVSLICQAMDFKGQISWDDTKPVGIPNRALDISALRKVMNYEPTGLDVGIRETLEKENWLYV
jgi:GDP-L-fucose synthase